MDYKEIDRRKLLNRKKILFLLIKQKSVYPHCDCLLILINEVEFGLNPSTIAKSKTNFDKQFYMKLNLSIKRLKFQTMLESLMFQLHEQLIC